MKKRVRKEVRSIGRAVIMRVIVIFVSLLYYKRPGEIQAENESRPYVFCFA